MDSLLERLQKGRRVPSSTLAKQRHTSLKLRTEPSAKRARARRVGILDRVVCEGRATDRRLLERREGLRQVQIAYRVFLTFGVWGPTRLGSERTACDVHDGGCCGVGDTLSGRQLRSSLKSSR